MATEIERKYLVISNDWKADKVHTIVQGYLSKDKERIVRIRIYDSFAYITIKGITKGISRAEYEYEIPLQDGLELLKICIRPIIEKKRSIVEYKKKKWEIDEFAGDNSGLIIAEIELEDQEDKCELPPWIGKDVSDDARYYNASLIENPYNTWKNEKA